MDEVAVRWVEAIRRHGFYGAVKFAFEKGKLRQVVESYGFMRETARASLLEVLELLRLMEREGATGYVVVEFRGDRQYRMGYVRTIAGEELMAEAGEFERIAGGLSRSKDKPCHEAQGCLFFEAKPKRRRRWVQRKE